MITNLTPLARTSRRTSLTDFASLTGAIAMAAGLSLAFVCPISGCSSSNDRQSQAASKTQPKHQEQTKTKVQTASTPTTLVLPSLDAQEPADYPGLHQVVAYADGIYSGAAPEGPEAFQSLKALGIRTIVSVDGGKPEVERAKAEGLRYVHLPIGYSGMSHERTMEIARAVRDLPGPTYIHCHHGKHRSAGAAGAAVVTLGKGTSAQMLERMKVSGTAANYTGLFKCVNIAQVASEAEFEKTSNAFPEVWQTTGMIQAMVEIDAAYEHLKLIQEAGWTTPSDHPDLVPAAEAGRLADLFRNLQDDSRVESQGEEMANWMKKDSDLASKVEEALAAANPKAGKPADIAALDGWLKQLGTSCKDCHAKYRDQ